jgi:flavorubredoxin
MKGTVTEIARDVYRISAFHEGFGIQFNQFLIDDDEPFLMHTGYLKMFDVTREGVASVLDPSRLRWIGSSHFEADECGAINRWLESAPRAQPACSFVGAMVSMNDFADRPARALADGEILEIGRHRLRFLATPHVPHGWEAGVLFEETTSTLLCGDLFTQLGDGPAVRTESPMEPAIVAEDAFGYSSLTPSSAPTVERLAELAPTTLALMHGPTYVGDGAHWLRDLAADYRRRVDLALAPA